MAIAKKVSARDLGQALVEVVQNEPRVNELWVSKHPDIHFWVIVEPMDLDAQRPLYALTDPLHERFPGAEFDFHILNPSHHRGDIHQALPSFAQQIALRAD